MTELTTEYSSQRTALPEVESSTFQLRTTYLISYAVLSERFSFWGLQAVLLLFLVQTIPTTQTAAIGLVSSFGALSYAFSLLGGILSDKYFGVWRASFIGLTFCFAGNCLLFASNDLSTLYIGLSFVLVGAGLFSPGSSSLVKILYDKKPELRESGFLAICIAGNISGALSPFIYGIFGVAGWWHGAFLTSAILNGIALLCFFLYAKPFITSKHVKQCLLSVFGLVIAGYTLLSHANLMHHFFLAGTALLSIFFVFFLRKLSSEERQQVGFIVLLTLILLSFYVSVFQIYTSLTIFISKYVDRHVFKWLIPTPAFSSLQCVFFIICAPVIKNIKNTLRKHGYQISLLATILLGLSIGTTGFAIFSIGEYFARSAGYCGMFWIILGNFFLGLGEVFLYPPILSAVSVFSPKKWLSTMMGGFSISLALSIYLSGKVANYVANQWTNLSVTHYSVLDLGYARISICLVGIALITLCVFLFLKKWYDQQEILLNTVS